MKKLRFFLVSVAAMAMMFTGCKNTKETPAPDNSVGKATLTDVVNVAAASYKTWEDGEEFPTTFKVGKLDLSIAEYQFAICKALVNINAGKKDDIEILTYKPAEHPEKDSYDKETIAVANGPKNGDETEDLVNVATRMLARMESDLRVPNQTNFTRNGSAIAFSTNRATLVISRALAGYKAEGKLAESVSADYKGAAATLKAFATELVKYLDVWEKTVGTVDADGSHNGANAWQNVHFIPIEPSGGYTSAPMYDQGQFPVWHPVVDGREYTAAECWSVAAQGIMDLVTVEGSSLLQPQRNPFVHTMGNGKSLSEPIPTPAEYATVTGFNAYPWYENTNDSPIINFSEELPCTVEFLCHELGWYLTRCTQFDTPAIGNFQQFGKGESVINYGDYNGVISAMRTFLIMIRFYDYLLKNNINENVWDAVKDVHLNYDLYGVEMPDIELKTKTLDFDCVQTTKEAKFVAKKAWTATASDSWITIEPASGDAAEEVVVKITAAENKGDERTGKVIIKGGNVTSDELAIEINQVKWTEPSTATIKDFAQEYVKVIDAWAANVGKINRLSAWELAKDGDEDVVEDAHYVPADFTIMVGGKTYNTADMLETALRSFLRLRGFDGNEVEKNGFGNIPTADPVDMSATLTKTHDYSWGSPLIESSNGGYFYKKDGDKQVYGQVELFVLDNWAQRSVNFQHGKNITNFCGYPREDHNITTYGGCFSSGRALLTYAFFFKYMLENGLERADDLANNTVFRTELFGLETATDAKPTILDFAKEYVKIIKIWESNVGTINRLSAWELAKPTDSDVVEDANYIPAGTTIMLGNKSYNTADMLETALRSFLLLRGFDGLETEKNGFGNIPAATPVAMSTTEVPPTHQYSWGSPLIETSNGGYFYKKDGDNKVYGQVEVKILDNWAQRSVNFSHGQNITNFCGYPREDHGITNYGGCFSSGRALLTFAFFFKYLLDNNLDKADALTGTEIIRTELFGIDTAPKPTLQLFAKEFVKGLSVWEKTVGNVDADGVRNRDSKEGPWKNVHLLPIVGNTSSDYYKFGGNQYDATLYKPWGVVVGKTKYTASQAWEIAIRGLLEMCTSEGQAFLDGMDDRNKAYTLADGKALSALDVPETSADNKWGKHPWYEGGNLVKVGGKDVQTVDVNFILKVGAWHVVRSFIKTGGNSSPLGMVGNFQEFGTSSGTLNLQNAAGENYVGYIAPMRELLVLMRIYKYILDKNVDANVYTAIKDKNFNFGLYNASNKAQWEFCAANMPEYAYMFGGEAGVADKKAGDGKLEILSNYSDGGSIAYVSVDKTSIDTDSKFKRIVGDTGHPYVTGPWTGDYWLFTLNTGTDVPSGTKAHIKYITRTSKTGPKYWVIEYLDGETWKPAAELKTADEVEHNLVMEKDGSTNVTVDVEFTTTAAMPNLQFRQRVVSMIQANGGAALTKPNGGTARIAGSAFKDGASSSPVFEIVK